MTRFKKELIARGVVYEREDPYNFYEDGRTLVAVTKQYIITRWWSNVMPSEIHLFDRNFNMIGSQNLYPGEHLITGKKTWDSKVYDKLSFQKGKRK